MLCHTRDGLDNIISDCIFVILFVIFFIFYFLCQTKMADAAIQTSFEACEGRDGKLKDALLSLINISNENEARLKELKGEHESLRQANDAHTTKMAEENENRKKEFSSLDEKQKADAYWHAVETCNRLDSSSRFRIPATRLPVSCTGD